MLQYFFCIFNKYVIFNLLAFSYSERYHHIGNLITRRILSMAIMIWNRAQPILYCAAIHITTLYGMLMAKTCHHFTGKQCWIPLLYVMFCFVMFVICMSLLFFSPFAHLSRFVWMLLCFCHCVFDFGWLINANTYVHLMIRHFAKYKSPSLSHPCTVSCIIRLQIWKGKNGWNRHHHVSYRIFI